MWWLLFIIPVSIFVLGKISIISEKDYYDMPDNGDDWYYKNTTPKKEDNDILTT